MSIDLMDLSGEHQNDIDHDIQKIRLDEKGKVIDIHGSSTSLPFAEVELADAKALTEGQGLTRDWPIDHRAEGRPRAGSARPW